MHRETRGRHNDEPRAVQPRLFMTVLVQRYGSAARREADIATRLPEGFICTKCDIYGSNSELCTRRCLFVRSVRAVTVLIQRDQRHDLLGRQRGPVALIPGHAPAREVQEQRVRSGAQAPLRPFASRTDSRLEYFHMLVVHFLDFVRASQFFVTPVVELKFTGQP